MKTVKFLSLGCKVNQYDTQSIRERFLSRGFEESADAEAADVYVVNTCTVTLSADRKSKSALKRCARENPASKIIVTGCLVKKDAETLRALKNVHFIVSKDFFPDGITSFSGRTRAFLKVQDGCDNRCSYCKVPLVRGASRSRPPQEILKEASTLVKNGFKEIVLTGICLGSYGKGLYPKAELCGLLASLESIEGLLRIRLSSIEAGDVSPALIERIASSKKICRHLHIPMQSGDDEILRKMNRRYSAAGYLDLVRMARCLMPDIAVSTDIMVGFPGEEERHFNNTLELIRLVQPMRVHIFPFSPRPHTQACGLAGRVDTLAIEKRIRLIQAVAKAAARAYKKKSLGKEALVLFEEERKGSPGIWEGRTEDYLNTCVKTGLSLQNTLARVKIKEVKEDCLIATLVK